MLGRPRLGEMCVVCFEALENLQVERYDGGIVEEVSIWDSADVEFQDLGPCLNNLILLFCQPGVILTVAQA